MSTKGIKGIYLKEIGRGNNKTISISNNKNKTVIIKNRKVLVIKFLW